MKKTNVIIIGAGPAGLAIAGRLAAKGKDEYLVLEAKNKVGHSWHSHYDRLHLHTVKQLSYLPHRPFPESYPLYVPRELMATYLEEYAEHFNIQPHFDQQVSKIERENGHWKVETQSEQYLAEHIVIATGVNNVPRIPDWPGKDLFQGRIVHSRNYKNPEPFKDQRVLVIGMGNTGAEIALDLANHGIETYLSVRSAISLVPRDLNGQPVQLTARRLAKLPFGLGDWLGSQIRKIYFGNLEPYGLSISKMHPAVQLRETGKTPVIDIGTIAAIKKGKIKIVDDIASFSAHSVTTKSQKEQPVDSVILATGYLADLEHFIPGVSDHLDDHGLPKSPIAHGALEKMYFIGFDNYKLGGILGTIKDDSQLIVDQIIQEQD